MKYICLALISSILAGGMAASVRKPLSVAPPEPEHDSLAPRLSYRQAFQDLVWKISR